MLLTLCPPLQNPTSILSVESKAAHVGFRPPKPEFRICFELVFDPHCS